MEKMTEKPLVGPRRRARTRGYARHRARRLAAVLSLEVSGLLVDGRRGAK